MRLLLKVSVSGLLLALFLWRTPLDQIWLHLQQLDALSLSAALILSFVAWWLSAVRLWSLLPEYRLAELVRATFIALFYATVLPGQIAGDVVKAYRLGRTGTRTGHAEAATLIDRILAILAMFCIGAISAVSSASAPVALRIFFVCGAAGILLGGLIVSGTFFRHVVLERLLPPGTNRIRNFVRHFAIALHDCLRHPARMATALVLALLFHALCIVIQMLLGRALHLPLDWADWAVVYAGVTLLVLLPISVAGIGLRESGYVGMLALFGAGSAAALSLSFTMFALTLAGAVVGGGLELANTPRGQRQGTEAR